VPKGQARFRLQVMAKHTPQNISDAVTRLKTAYEEASAELEWLNAPAEETRQVA
jgi:glycine C-acetyltransferase